MLVSLVFGMNAMINAQPNQHHTQTRITEDLYYSQLSDSIFMITHYFPFWGGNSMLVVLPGHKGVLIDTPYESTGMQSLLDWIESRFDELELTVIVTGFHQDNLGGNELLRARGIDVYGADRTAILVSEEGPSFKNFLLESVENNENKKYLDSYQKLTFIPPNKTFPIHEGLKLEIENEIFEVFFPGESHTVDNTVVYLHHHKILFGGCMFKGLMYQSPGYLGYANMKEWPGSIEKVMERFPDCRIVIPGHGDFGDKSVLSHTLEIVKKANEK